MYLTQPLHRAVQQYPDRVVSIDGDRTRTFAEHVGRVARLAGALRGLGVGPGDRVAMYAENSDAYLEYLNAVPWADGVLVPVNTRWSQAEVAHCLDDAEVGVLLVDDRYRDQIAGLRARCRGLTHVVHVGVDPEPGWIGYEAAIASASPIADARRGGDELAALFYTGGTTGGAKGVMLSHANIIISALGAAATSAFATPGGRYLHSAPMFHLADLAMWQAHSLLGNTHVVVPGFEPRRVLSTIAEHGVTDLFLVPTMIQMLLDHPDFAVEDLAPVRRFAYGASSIPPALLDRVTTTLPHVDLVQAYGMTELSPIATILGPADHHPDAPQRYSAGRAAPHAEVRVVDPDGREVPTGTVGEVACRGAHVMLGYWKQPSATADAVRDGWMHTGDGGYLDDDGYLHIVDRIKDMIVTGGENVYSAEVEKALHEHPAVAACAVIGVPDDTYGERVHAVVVGRPGHDATAEGLRAHVKSLIAGYKAPRSVEFVDALPVSGAGKILKRELRAAFAEPGRA